MLELYVVKRFFRHVVEIDFIHRNFGRTVFVKQFSFYMLSCLTVPLSETVADDFVVACQSLVGFSRDSVLHSFGFNDSNEAVSVSNVGVEKRKRFAGFDRLDP